MSWDEAEQVVLALAALRQALGDADAPKQLAPLYRELAFPPGFESPRDFRRGPSLANQLQKMLQELPH
jgi:hypothetical protein